jgi:hypothetical protein
MGGRSCRAEKDRVEEVEQAADLREREAVPARAKGLAREVVPAGEEAWEGSEVARAEHACAPIAAIKSPTNRRLPVCRFNAPSAGEPWFGNRSDRVFCRDLEGQGNSSIL